ncbi:hypothetical protein [Streptomyces sp. NPDC051132]|uniref:hypothetical protein n=1 Tax=unclassified Streptomyces TaxID=2593676 RepID=UPI003441A0E8
MAQRDLVVREGGEPVGDGGAGQVAASAVDAVGEAEVVGVAVLGGSAHEVVLAEGAVAAEHGRVRRGVDAGEQQGRRASAGDELRLSRPPRAPADR